MTEHDASQPDGVPFIEDALSEEEAVESCQAFDEEFGPVFLDDEGPSDDVITSYSIHYTKLYEFIN